MKADLVKLEFKNTRLTKDKNIISSLLARTSFDLTKTLNDLKIRAEEQSALLAVIPALVFFKDKELNYLLVNNAFEDFFNQTNEEIRGKKILDLTDNYINDRYTICEREVISIGKPHYDIEEILKKDEEEYHFLTSIVPFRNPMDEIIGLVGVSWDVTERKKYEDELMKARDMAEAGTRVKSDFLASISHELRTPMNGIIGLCDILMQSGLSKFQQENLEDIMSNAHSLLVIISDILDFSRIESGKIKIEASDFSFRLLIHELETLIQFKTTDKGIDFRIFADDRIPQVLHGDATRLKQVLSNLLNNAYKFTDTGYIHLHINLLSEDEEQVVLYFRVEDTGIGIPHTSRHLLFQAFSQVNTKAKVRKGTGLGLAICKQIVKMMDGEIGIDGEEGKGSIFWFTVKLRKARKSLQEDIPVIPESRKGLYRERNNLLVLLVEDNKINQKITTFHLTRMGHEVDIVEDGRAALEKIENKRYDLVILDLQMPVMDGFETARKIRELEKESTRAIPIIALTANAMKGDRELCLDAGMNAYISKPFTYQDLEKSIRDVLD